MKVNTFFFIFHTKSELRGDEEREAEARAAQSTGAAGQHFFFSSDIWLYTVWLYSTILWLAFKVSPKLLHIFNKIWLRIIAYDIVSACLRLCLRLFGPREQRQARHNTCHQANITHCIAMSGTNFLKWILMAHCEFKAVSLGVIYHMYLIMYIKRSTKWTCEM